MRIVYHKLWSIYHKLWSLYACSALAQDPSHPPENPCPMRLLFACCAAFLLAGALPALPSDAPTRHGVVFFCPEQEQKALRQLEQVKADGFRLIEFASWVWTQPTPGSPLEHRAGAVLDWCDRNGVGFFLMHNIQFGSEGEGGGLDNQVLQPEKALPLVADWARVLKGHPSVLGVILGNEVGPHLGKPADNPRLWGQFRAYLERRHRTIAGLNSAWGTHYASFAEVGEPPAGSAGWVDYRRFANQVFARFYQVVFDRGFRPGLGERLYGNKTSPDPWLHRACAGSTMTCWDDMVSQHPLWLIKCAADTTGKPLFNSELHLYNDEYHYGPSPEQSRYRYFTSALLGEYLTASYAWNQWHKPEIARVHAATPGILDGLAKADAACRTLAQAYRHGDLAVLVTEDNYYRTQDMAETARHPLALLYARLGTLGRPWRYLLEDDLAGLRRGTLVVWTTGLSLPGAIRLAALPAAVRVIAVESAPVSDEYGRPLPPNLARRLADRLQAAPALPAAFRRLGTVEYLWWSPERGHFTYQVPYCLVEVRRAAGVVAVINNSPSPQTVPLPWGRGPAALECSTNQPLEGTSLDLGPFGVRIFRLTPSPPGRELR